MAKPKVSIIVVSFNTREAVRQCLRALDRVRDEAEFEVVLIDNASADGTGEMVVREFPDIHTTMNTVNRGFAAAVNQAVEMSQGEYIFLLNPDTWITRHCLARMVAVLDEHPQAAVAGAQLARFSGDSLASVLAAPNLAKEFLNLFPEIKFLLMPGFVKRFIQRRRQRQTQEAVEVPAVSGAAMLIRKSAFDGAGGFDERFFVYHEEVDLCLRLSKDSWRILFEPRAIVLHHDALATGYRTNRLARQPVLSWRLRGTAVLFEKHCGVGARKRFVALARGVLKVRSGVARSLAALRGQAGARWRNRAEELEMAAVSLLKPARSGP